MSDRVLVAMSRKEAERVRIGIQILERSHNADPMDSSAAAKVRAALDTDREELIAWSAKEIHRVIATANQQAPPDAGDYEDAARAVLALLENGGQE